MQLLPRPKVPFEVDTRSVLWGAAVQLVVAVPIFFLIGEWTLLLLTAVLAGTVASISGDFHAPAAETGAIAALLGTLGLVPILFARRFTEWQSAFLGTTDSAVFATIFTAGEALAIMPIAGILGYVSASIVGIVRRRRRVKKGGGSTKSNIQKLKSRDTERRSSEKDRSSPERGRN